MQGIIGLFRASLLLAALLTSSTARAQMRERYVVPDRGQSRAFVVAKDELHVAGPVRGPRAEVLRGARTAEATRQAAEKRRAATGETASVVLYEEGRPRTVYTRRVLTERITVELAPGADPAGVAAGQGLVNRGPAVAGTRWFVFETPKTGTALEAAEKLRVHPGVRIAEAQLARQQHKRFVPNDPFFSGQWHLSSASAPNVNVTPVWDNWKGTGIRIGIVDDGLQVTHEDLSPNVDTVNDHDWNDASPDDPSPSVSNQDFHGTSCAGVAAGRGNNGIGISGAAPEATLVGLRLIAFAETDTEESEAMLWKNDLIQIKSNSWGPTDDGLTLEGPGPLFLAAMEQAATQGRGGLGTIFTWAAGNGGDVGDNSNYDGYANSIYTIAVAAIANNGAQSFYSEPGANVVITAPSDGGSLGITTVDLTGNVGYNTTGTSSGNLSSLNYTNDFGGTSSACPLAAGCIALMLQSKPTLGWRDVQDILIRSAAKCASTDTDWVNNAAGLHFNHKYGPGLLDTQAAVARAATHTNLGTQVKVVSAPTTSGASSIPDNSTTGVTRTFNVTQNLRTEHVTVKVDITHARRGQLEVTLTSPNGTVSRLAETHATGTALADYANWTFMTVRNWGELSAGTWTLKVADRTGSTTGTLNSAELSVFGVVGNAPPVVSAATISSTGPVFSDEVLGVSGVVATDAEGDAITLAYQWQSSADGTAFTDLPGATATTLTLANAQSGRVVRCAVTGSSGGQSGAAFYTAAAAVDRRPGQLARHGAAYSYDSDLFLVGSGGSSFARAAIINEFSQGPSGGTSEWIELLTTQTVDLRGWSIGDAGGTYTTFSNVAAWSSVPAGTLIVIYNGATTRDPTIAGDDVDATDRVLIMAHTNATFLTSTATTFSLPNSSGDSIILKNAAGTVVDGLSYGTASGQTPALPNVGSATSAAFTGSTDAAAELATSWTNSAFSAATPGAANGGQNTALVTSLRSGAQFRFAAASDVVPGLSIDAATGVVSGSPNVAAGGFFQLVIERFSGITSVTRSYPLLVADSAGNFSVPSGKTWTLNADAVLTGDLTVNGTLDTAGRSLVVGGTLTTTGATVLNATGLITYLHRSGPLPPGAITLVANPQNDLRDDDADGVPNLLELLLGTDPGGVSGANVAIGRLANGNLQLEVSFPIGATGVQPVVEVSADLVNWLSGAGYTSTVTDSTSGGMRTLTVQSVATAAPLYIRLRAAR